MHPTARRGVRGARKRNERTTGRRQAGLNGVQDLDVPAALGRVDVPEGRCTRGHAACGKTPGNAMRWWDTAARARDLKPAGVLKALPTQPFFMFERRRLPLKLGFGPDLVAAVDPPIDRQLLGQALRYRQAQKVGVARIDLDGNACRTVSEADARVPRKGRDQGTQTASNRAGEPVPRGCLFGLAGGSIAIGRTSRRPTPAEP
jgi:ProQ/FINO family